MNLQTFLAQFGITQHIDAKLIGRSYYRNAALDLLKFNPLYSGECIAHERGTHLIPSTTFLQWMAKHAQHTVTVDEEGAWLFICRRDIISRHVKKHTKPPVGAQVIVLNKYGDCLGYAKLTGPLSSKQVVLRHHFDIGDLLRREP